MIILYCSTNWTSAITSKQNRLILNADRYEKIINIYNRVTGCALTACNEDFNEGVASPQSYGQEEAAGKITFTATGVAPINLGNVEEESVAVAVFTAPAVEEEATLSYKMKLDNKVTLIVDDKGYVATEDLQRRKYMVSVR